MRLGMAVFRVLKIDSINVKRFLCTLAFRHRSKVFDVPFYDFTVSVSVGINGLHLSMSFERKSEKKILAMIMHPPRFPTGDFRETRSNGKTETSHRAARLYGRAVVSVRCR